MSRYIRISHRYKKVHESTHPIMYRPILNRFHFTGARRSYVLMHSSMGRHIAVQNAQVKGLSCDLTIQLAKCPKSRFKGHHLEEHYKPQSTCNIGSKKSCVDLSFWAQIWIFTPPRIAFVGPIPHPFFFLYYFNYFILLTNDYFIFIKKITKILFFTN